ncbi:hypothetical protein GOBAR_DD04148 [Gossypium barbadense]|nr:hypothetical protein GOBAR_DD04148 [Gossypium barbadense]
MFLPRENSAPEVIQHHSSSSFNSLDKATKKVHMRKNDVGEEDHLMAVDVIGISNGIEKPANSRVSFQDMLLGASRSILKSIRDTIGKVIKLDVNTALGEMNQENLISDENRKDLDIFGPWMVVNRRNSILSRKSAIGREERKGSTVSQGLDQALGLVDPNAAGSSKMVNGSSKQSAKNSTIPLVGLEGLPNDKSRAM